MTRAEILDTILHPKRYAGEGWVADEEQPVYLSQLPRQQKRRTLRIGQYYPETNNN